MAVAEDTSGVRNAADTWQAGTAESAVLQLQRWTAVSALVLIGATFRLWLPTALNSPFPQIPLIESLAECPLWVDWLSSLGLVLGWCLVFFSKTARAGCCLVLMFGWLLILLNQHRFQPWHYQMLVFATLFLVARAELQVRALRCFVISIYIYSALSKFDFEFLHTVGPQFVATFLESIGFAAEANWNPTWASAAIPAAELIVALGLIWPVTRWTAAVAAIALHAGLVFLLGPLGMEHSWGVVLWNVYFMGLVWLLFLRPSLVKETVSVGEQNPTPAFSAAELCVWLCLVPVVVLPAVERMGWWDHWPSWALYAPHSSRAQIFVATTVVERLPEPLKTLLPEDMQETDIWVRVPLDEWSLQSLQVPVYPQARFQLGIGRYLADQLDSDFEIKLRILGTASRWDGKRDVQEALGRREMDRDAQRFLFSSAPRRPSRSSQPN